VVECLFDLGCWDEALELADQLLARHRDLDQPYEGVSLTARKAHILACRGAVAEAVALKDRFLPRGRDIGDPQVTSNVLPIAAFIEQTGGSTDAAVALVEELEGATRDGPACYRADPLRQFGVVLEQGQALLGAGRCATRLGDSDPEGPDSGAALGRARTIFEGLGATALTAETDRLLAQTGT